MTFLQISAFREVMRLGSISAAAKSLLRSQPAVSMQISSLEDELNCELFERQGRRLVPVPEAHYVLREAERILDAIGAVEKNINGLNRLKTGELTIVSMPGATVDFLPNLLSNFLRDKPDVKVSIISRTSQQVEQMIATQQYDIGLADALVFGQSEREVVNEKLFSLPCYCAISKGDPLSQKSSVTSKDLDGKNLGCLTDDHPMTKTIERSFQTAGATFNRRIQTRYFTPLFRFVSLGQCYGLVDALARDTYLTMNQTQSNIEFVPFEPSFSLSVSLMTPKHRPLSSLAKQFEKQLSDKLNALGSRQ